MKASEIVCKYLADNGYDGLCQLDGDCACLLENFMSCDYSPCDYGDCEAAYKHTCDNPVCETEYYISVEKDKAKTLCPGCGEPEEVR